MATLQDIGRVDNMISDVSPNHYAKWKIEPITFVMVNDLPFAEGNVIKYVMRHRDKDGVRDIDKAIRYLNMIKENTYGQQPEQDADKVPSKSGSASWSESDGGTIRFPNKADTGRSNRTG